MIDSGSKSIARILNWIFLMMCLLMFVFPVFWMYLNSFKPTEAIFSSTPVFLFRPTLRHYLNVFSERGFLNLAINSVIVSSVSVAISMLIGTLASYSLARFNIKGARAIATWMLSIRMFPPIVTMIPIFIIMRNLGLLNTRLSLIIVYQTINIPIVVWMMLEFFRNIPKEIEEAAMVEGCSQFQTFYRIAIPLSKPGLAGTAVFCLIFTFNEFLDALILTAPQSRTLPVGVAGLVGSHSNEWGAAYAGGGVTVLPLLIFLFLARRYFLRGLTLGAIK